ncbi:hypothetical protein [Streptomyces bottropensis]
MYAADATGWVLTGRWTIACRPFLELHRPRPTHVDPDPTATGKPVRP